MTAFSDLGTWPQMRRHDGSQIRVLIIEDEVVIADMLSLALRMEGWDVDSAHTCSSAAQSASASPPDAVILDIQLPDGCGLKLLEILRLQRPDLPVLVLSARDAPEDRVAGLRAGGDDYVTKASSIEEVVLRLRNMLRHRGATVVGVVGRGSSLVVGDLLLDVDSREVARAGAPIVLTCTEFELLKFLMQNSRRVLSKTQILEQIWNYDFVGRSNVVGLYISYLRKKIDTGRAPMIHTLRGVGYVLKPAA
jgi:two-component system OmpR family response regulator